MKLLIEQALHTIARLGNSKQVILFSMSNNDKAEIIGKVIGVCSEGKFTMPTEKLINIMDTPFKKVVLTKQPLSYSTTLLKPLLPFPIPDDDNLECLCLPLLVEESQQVKAIVILIKEINNLPENKVSSQTLSMFSPLIAAIIEADQKNTNLSQFLINDTLTGLHTQHYLEIRLQEELARIHRYDGEVSLLIIDIDSFSQINETCGYNDSNIILQELIKLLMDLIRSKIDLLCNYKDRQLAILLPNTSIDNACALAERLRQECEYRLFMTKQGIPIKMTLSIGVAHNVDIVHNCNFIDGKTEPKYADFVSEISKEELIHRAEVMLQAAKQAGCNKVMAWW